MNGEVENFLLKYMGNPQKIVEIGKEAGIEIIIRKSPINVAPGIYGSMEEKTELYKVTIKTDQVEQSYNLIMINGQPLSVKQSE